MARLIEYVRKKGKWTVIRCGSEVFAIKVEDENGQEHRLCFAGADEVRPAQEVEIGAHHQL